MKLEATDIKKLELLPGETLIVRYDSNKLIPVLAKRFKIDFKELFPDNVLWMIPDSIEIDKIIKTTEG